MKMQKIFWVFLVFFALSISVFAEDESEIITTEELTPGFINSIIQDDDGFLWIATQEGLNRYDGMEIINYFASIDGLNSNEIKSLSLDKKGQIVVGTSRGINFYNKNKDEFRSNKNFKEENFSDRLSIQKIVKDKEGNLFLATRKGLTILNGKKSRNIKFDNILNISLLSNKKLWIIREDGFYEYDTRDLKNKLLLKGKERINDIKECEKGIVLTSNTGIYLYKEKKPWQKLFADGVKLICDDKKGNFYFVDLKNNLWSLKIKDHIEIQKQDQINENISTIFVDKDQTLWIGLDSGLKRITLQSREFKNFKTEKIDKLHWIKQINKLTYMGTQNGLKIVNLKSNQVTNFFVGKDLEKAEIINSNQLAILTKENELILFDFLKGTYKNFKSEKECCLSNNILERLDDDTLWVSDRIFKISSLKFEKVIFSDRNFIKVQLDNIKNIWALTEDQKLYKISPLKKEFKSIDTKNLSINDIFIQKKEIILATNQGLYSMNLSNFKIKKIYEEIKNPIEKIFIIENQKFFSGMNQFFVIDKKNQIIDFSREVGKLKIRQIFKQDDENFWLTTNKGLVNLEISKKNCIFFSKKNGLSTLDFNAKGFMDSNGQIYIGGYRGFNYFDPKKIPKKKDIPKLKIIEILVDNEKYDLKSNINLNEGFKNIQIKFSMLEFSNPDFNLIGYKLSGYDKNWKYTQKENSVIYSNLKKGEYTFRIIGSNSFGVWNRDGEEVKINVKSIKTWEDYLKWFYTGLIIVAIVVSINAFLYRKKWQEELKEAKFAQKNNEKLQSLNQELQKISCTDALTKIGNRRGFDCFMQIHENIKTSISFILMDVDFFKQYNDTYGHLKGDECLYKIAQTLKNSLKRKNEEVFRFGGEEFIAVLIDVSENESRQIAKRLREEIIKEKIKHEKSSVLPFVTLSVGVVFVEENNFALEWLQGIIDEADQNLYHAKRKGRNKEEFSYFKKK